MPTRYQCSDCKGTFDVAMGPAPVCENGLGQMSVTGTGTSMPTPQTGCKKGKQKFLASSFEQSFFVPSTARGKFDCSYRPTTGRLYITVKLSATFGGSFFEWFSGAEQASLKSDLSDGVPVYWDGKCTLRCTRHGWTDIAVQPVFAVTFGSSGSHFKLIISREDELAKSNPHGRECRGFVSMNQVQGSDVQDRVELRDFQTREFNHTVGGLLTAGNDRSFLEDALTACGATVERRGADRIVTAIFPFANVSTDTAAIAAHLREFVRRVNLQLTGSHPVPVVVKGFIRVPEAPDLARQRADAVRTILTTAAIKNPVTVDPVSYSGNPSVEITIDRTYENAFATGGNQFQYNVAAHEFGHMIGLPDEYENPTTGPKFVVKTNYLALVGRAGLLPPVFPSHTSSMMSDGMTMMGWHYVTAWEALAALTRDFLNENEWAIHV